MISSTSASQLFFETGVFALVDDDDLDPPRLTQGEYQFCAEP